MSNATNDQSNLGPTNATNPTECGKSVESKDQIKDATLVATAEPAVLNIYRLVPIAEHPRWGNSSYQGVVVVAAWASGDARIVAAERELDFLEVDAAPADDVTRSNASAFRSEKLYTVVEIDHARRDLARGVYREGGYNQPSSGGISAIPRIAEKGRHRDLYRLPENRCGCAGPRRRLRAVSDLCVSPSDAQSRQ